MQDVQSPIDLQQLNDARRWASEVMDKRPYRVRFFEEFALQLNNSAAASVLELGSGPGFLASHLLNEMANLEYTAYDFSTAMHFLAKERLGANADRVNFVVGNFKEVGWESILGEFNAVITLQAVHEVRHKERVPALFRAVKSLLKEKGIFLYCDHFCGESAMQNNSLYMSTHEQEQCLAQAGFSNVTRTLSIGTLNFWFAAK
jgi:SAM-dependent methyltransferase